LIEFCGPLFERHKISPLFLLFFSFYFFFFLKKKKKLSTPCLKAKENALFTSRLPWELSYDSELWINILKGFQILQKAHGYIIIIMLNEYLTTIWDTTYHRPLIPRANRASIESKH